MKGGGEEEGQRHPDKWTRAGGGEAIGSFPGNGTGTGSLNCLPISPHPSPRCFCCRCHCHCRPDVTLAPSVAMASTSAPLALSSSHVFLASRELSILRTSKVQVRSGWRAASGARAMASEGAEGASRREVTVAAVLASLSLATTVGFGEDAEAVSSSRRALRSEQVPESEYKTLPNGLKYYDVKVGGGKRAEKGSRVAVHYVAKWKGLTFMTSRQGMGVTGGTPYGFDIGASEYGIVLKGLDYGVEGMRVGGQRLLIVPPELAYGNKGVQEIPPNATLQFDVELLSIKQDAFGSRVKIVEG